MKKAQVNIFLGGGLVMSSVIGILLSLVLFKNSLKEQQASGTFFEVSLNGRKDSARKASVEMIPVFSQENSIPSEPLKAVENQEQKILTDGVLWMDPEYAHIFVTLGTRHGLKSKERLSVYEGERKISEVQAVNVFDVISFVKPLASPEAVLAGQYYRVVKDSSQP